MLIYGTKFVLLGTKRLTAAACPSCGTNGSVELSIGRKHAHLFWIPMFPLGKVGVSECVHCKHTMSTKEMPLGFQQEFKNWSGEAKGPLWQYTGIALFPLLIIAAMYNSDKEKEKELLYLEHPQLGDIYQYKYDKEYYSTMKVVGVTEDSVYVVLNSVASTSVTKMSQITKEENYIMELPEGYSIGDLKQKLQSGEIVDVIR